MECALVVYLRYSSFEVHGLLPHRHAKVVLMYSYVLLTRKSLTALLLYCTVPIWKNIYNNYMGYCIDESLPESGGSPAHDGTPRCPPTKRPKRNFALPIDGGATHALRTMK